jgi:hypothetical protein
MGDVETALLNFGLDFGFGWKFAGPIGLTLGFQLEQVTDGELLIKNFTDDGLFYDESLIRLLPGITLALVYLWPNLAKATKGVYLCLESQYALIEDRAYPRRDNEFVIMAGISVAF